VQGGKLSRTAWLAQACDGQMRVKGTRLAREPFGGTGRFEPDLKLPEAARRILHAEPEDARRPMRRKSAGSFD
jgi:hypothetical protein